MPEAMVKAAGFNTAVNIIREMCTPEEYARLLASLSPETVAKIKDPAMAVTWLPHQVFHELVKVAHLTIFAGDAERIAEAARRAALNDLSTIYRIFIRFMSPSHVIERAASLWKTYVRDNGEVFVTRTGSTSIEVFLKGLTSTSPSFWAYQGGSIRGIIQATGIYTVKVAIVRGGQQDSNCVFDVSWS